MGENGHMPTCPSCGAENLEASRFCGACGTPLAAVSCASCGAANPSEHRFCGQCGAALSTGAAHSSEQARPAADERKLATVLFADVVGFTSLAERSDPEAVARTVDGAFRRMTEEVVEHGGIVDKYTGDSLMAVFGVPQAHEDDAERAVTAALSMRQLRGDLAVSIGVNSGPVMVTSVGRDGALTVIGDTVNVAARLEKAAAPGEVLVGRLTAELTGDRVVYRERQPVVLKGKRDPVEVREATSVRVSGASAARPDRPPLLGRDDELAFLRAQWRNTVRNGRASIVLLCGEAGVGTTRLVDELAEEVADSAMVVRAVYPAYGRLGGLRVATEIIRQLGPMGDTAVDSRVRSIAGELHPSLRGIDPAAFQKEQAWAFRRLVETKAAEQPLLVVIDDIHRSGDKVLDLLDEMFRRVVEVPVLLVLVGRPEPNDWLARFPAATTVRLGPIAATDAIALADALLPDAPLDREAAASLAHQAGGNPLAVRELVRMVSEQGGLVKRGDEYGLVGGLTLPPTLHAIVAARLDALPQAQKTALQQVAVLGDAVGEEQMAALFEGDAPEALQGLVAAGLVHRSRRDDDTCYEFADPLLQEVAYETLPRHVRGEGHRRAAAVAAASIDRARHLERAATYLPDDDELRVEAATAAAIAGLELIEAFRLNDGVQLVQRAIELGYREPRDLLRLARALNEQQRAEELWEVLDLVPDDPDQPALAAEKIHMAAVALTFRDPAAGLPGLEEAARRWSALGETAKHGWALANRGVALFFLGRNRESDAALRESLGVFREAGERDGQMAAYRFLALVCPEDPHAHEWVTESLQRAEEVGDRTAQVNSYNTLSWHHFIRSRLGGSDDTTELRYYLDRLIETAHDLGMHELETHGLGMAANLARLQGRVDDACRIASAALSLAVTEPPSTALVQVAAFSSARGRGDPAHTPEVDERSVDPVSLFCAYLIGEELILQGRADGIARAIDALDRRPTQSALEGLIAGFGRALALIVLGRHAEARSSAEWVIASATTLHAPIAEAAGRALLAEVSLVVDGDRGEAVRLLETGPAVSGGLAHVLVLRVRARLGNEAASRALAEAVDALHMPGLALPVGVMS
jgi:class 3 adenylate cyclase/tetratricopeptide (TPR) repeat protein